MDMRTFVGLCAALAFAAGSPGAHAIKIFDDAPVSRTLLMAGMDTFTYAAETLLTGDVDVTAVDGDSTTYHNIGGTEALVLSAPADVGASAGNAYTVTVTLDGMVFRDTAATLAATTALAPPSVGSWGVVQEPRRWCSAWRAGPLTRQHQSST